MAYKKTPVTVGSDSVGVTELKVELKDEVALGATTAIDWSLGITFTKVLSAGWTMTFTNPIVGKTIMVVTNGAFSITLPSGCDTNDIVNYDTAKRNVLYITCVSNVIPLYSISDKSYTI